MKPTPRHTPGAVIFDLDGTLVDSEPFWAAGFSTGLASILRERGYGEHRIDKSDMARFRGGRVPDTVAEIVDWLGLGQTLRGPELDVVVAEVIASVTRAFAADPTPIADAVDTARQLAQSGVRMAVASSSAAPFIDAALAAIGLEHAFPVRVSAVGLPHGKPDPLVYQLALDRLQVPGRLAVAIEDSPVGVAAAVNAGMQCVWFAPESDGPQGRLRLADLVPLLRDDRGDRLRDSVTIASRLTAETVTRVLDRVTAKEHGA